MTANPDLQAALDSRLEAALSHAFYRSTLNTQKMNARLKLEHALVYAVNGGTFNITRELISFTAALAYRGKETVILIDANLNPIEIENIDAFNEKITDIYLEAINEYTIEIKTLGKARTTKAAIGEI